MSNAPAVHKNLSKIVISAILALFLLPLITWLFTKYALPVEALNTPSENLSPLWQFQLVQKASLLSLLAGVLMLVFICGLGAIAFANRKMQYLSFVIGWRILTLFCAAEVVIQGVMLVWLAFWLTAFFFNIYILKLIALAAILAGVAVFSAIVYIFKRVPNNTELQGEILDSSSAEKLWDHINALAIKTKTAAPDHIVAGIDTNFFVTESTLTVRGKRLNGRSLFVSLPLLRLLNRDEADAVLAHELAHFRGGDAASSAALGPKIAQYDYYSAMQASGAAFIAYYILRLYRIIFEFALKRDSRAREFIADQTAASIVSGRAIINALIKISAYSRYRNLTEQKLFAELVQHGSNIGIASRITEGLAPYATSMSFLESMQTAAIPHPFDSHPALSERMRNVNHVVQEQDYSSIVVEPTVSSWIIDIPNADNIEQVLWSQYESQFAVAHEQQLAYRYVPSNAAEQAVVLKYFPPVEYNLKKSRKITISYEGLILPDQDKMLPWEYVENLQYENAIGSDILRITHPKYDWYNGANSSKVKVSGDARKQREKLKATLGQYWQRHQIMRKELENSKVGIT